jgi:uncharacterized protein (DUF1499 family)
MEKGRNIIMGTAEMVATLCCVGILLVGCAMVRPSTAEAEQGKLSACPISPNCVSSQSTDVIHKIEPLAYKSSKDQAYAELKKIIHSMKRTKIVKETDSYLHVEFRSALFRFVDDVEFYFDEGAKLIQVRSASRIGYSDLGVNRRRIESIRAEPARMEGKR